jgi:hypothetical protein
MDRKGAWASGAEGVEINFVLATQFEIFQAGAVAQGVVGKVEDVIRLVIGQMNLEQVQVVVDGIDEATPRSAAGRCSGSCRRLAALPTEFERNTEPRVSAAETLRAVSGRLVPPARQAQ